MTERNSNMDEAPKDRPILLLIDDNWVEGEWYQYKEYPGSWSKASFNSDGCGCCSSSNGEPTAWAELPQ